MLECIGERLFPPGTASILTERIVKVSVIISRALKNDQTPLLELKTRRRVSIKKECKEFRKGTFERRLANSEENLEIIGQKRNNLMRCGGVSLEKEKRWSSLVESMKPLEIQEFKRNVARYLTGTNDLKWAKRIIQIQISKKEQREEPSGKRTKCDICKYATSGSLMKHFEDEHQHHKITKFNF